MGQADDPGCCASRPGGDCYFCRCSGSGGRGGRGGVRDRPDGRRLGWPQAARTLFRRVAFGGTTRTRCPCARQCSARGPRTAESAARHPRLGATGEGRNRSFRRRRPERERDPEPSPARSLLDAWPASDRPCAGSRPGARGPRESINDRLSRAAWRALADDQRRYVCSIGLGRRWRGRPTPARAAGGGAHGTGCHAPVDGGGGRVLGRRRATVPSPIGGSRR